MKRLIRKIGINRSVRYNTEMAYHLFISAKGNFLTVDPTLINTFNNDETNKLFFLINQNLNYAIYGYNYLMHKYPYVDG